MNEIEKVKIENGIIYLIQEMLEAYSEKHHVSFDDALDGFTKSKTYEALYDFDTKLFREGPDYLLEWYEKEIEEFSQSENCLNKGRA